MIANGKTLEKTGPQNRFGTGVYGISDYHPYQLSYSWFEKVARMRIDPTIAFLRTKYAAAVTMPGFNLAVEEDTPEEIEEFVRKQVASIFEDTARASAYGCLDYGNQPFEIVYKVKDGQFCYDKLKPLLQELTEILIYGDTGEYAGIVQGVTQETALVRHPVVLTEDRSFLVAINVEGTNWYGRPIMLNLECAYDSKVLIEAQAMKFDANVAAEHWAVYYPPGRNDTGLDSNGDVIWEDNQATAIKVLTALRESGSAVIPSEVDRKIQDLGDNSEDGKSSWKIELLTAARTSGAPYNERLQYKDVEYARGIGFAERSVFEGRHGTKAEAEAHAEASAGGPYELLINVCQAITDQLIPDLIFLNFGPEHVDAIKCVANPITDEQKEYMKSLYDKFLNQSEVALNEYDATDMNQFAEVLNIPRLTEEEIRENEEEAMEKQAEILQQMKGDEDSEPTDDEDEQPTELSLAGCGANAPGGGGFQPGNTCASGGGAGEKKRADKMTPPHGVRDKQKFEKLKTDMSTHGWKGRPLLVQETASGTVALTGSHRLAAAQDIQENDRDFDVPVVMITMDDAEKTIDGEMLSEALGNAATDEQLADILSEFAVKYPELKNAADLMQREIDESEQS